MRPLLNLILAGLIAPFALTACGTTEKTVVVNAPPGSTVVVPGDGENTRVITR
jgi:hypothetical protein